MELQTKTICDYVGKYKEFDYIKEVSKFYNINFYHLCDFALDLYNYQRRQGLDKVGAKIMSLNNTSDYAYSLSQEYRRK